MASARSAVGQRFHANSPTCRRVAIVIGEGGHDELAGKEAPPRRLGADTYVTGEGSDVHEPVRT
jgi:putative NIF3 family GTP cyclohydrolase 1 type 2